MMRAALRANSSSSAEPPFTGSDGALTATPRFAVPAWASEVSDGLYSRPPQVASWLRQETRASGKKRRRRAPFNLALVILRDYGILRQSLELAAISPREDGRSAAGTAAAGRGVNGHDLEIAPSAGAAATPLRCGDADRRRG